MPGVELNYLKQLESESIYILREVAANYQRPTLLYSAGKDSSVLLHLVRKAFSPDPIPFPLLHIDTGFKFPEMYTFRDRVVSELKLKLIVERNETWIQKACHPREFGVSECCRHLKTEALLQAIEKHKIDAAIGGARREEEKSRAKERFFSIRNAFGHWDPKQQRPELWDLFNTELNHAQSMRVFPLNDWTELDIWTYIKQEKIAVPSLYFSKKRPVHIENGKAFPPTDPPMATVQQKEGRFRSLGCMPCTAMMSSTAQTVEAVVEELKATKNSERENRLIDYTSPEAMEEKKRKGYF